jgi:prepilin-type N-terminal cleavage/methylation domain-containing protein
VVARRISRSVWLQGRYRKRGFSLVELALVLLILSLIMPPLVLHGIQSQAAQQQAQVREELQLLKQSLKGHLMQTGALPCPSGLLSQGQSLRSEAGECLLTGGFFPTAELALDLPKSSDGHLLDPWGRAYRYGLTHLDRDGNGATDWANAADVAHLPLVDLRGDLRVCEEPSLNSVCSAGGWTETGVALVYSTGRVLEADEAQAENLEEGRDRVWVWAVDEQLDDVFRWISPVEAVAWLVEAGRAYIP